MFASPWFLTYSSPWPLTPPFRLDAERTRNLYGHWAYRYNGHFYRTALLGYADVCNSGQYLANQIPKDDEEREKWIKQIITLIENEVLWRTERGIATTEVVRPEVDRNKPFTWISQVHMAMDHPVNDRTHIAFMDILPDHDLEWQCPDNWTTKWSYVIDLEDRAFTINGVLHFSFDRMPQNILQCLYRAGPCITYYRMTPQAELFHSTFVKRWPPSLQKPSEDCINSYPSISPIITPLEEWGPREWSDFNTSEVLSVYLVTTILHDQTTQIKNPELVGDRRMFAYCQWQLLTAAAPSAVKLSSLPVLSDSHSSSPGINLTLDMGVQFDPRMTFEFMRYMQSTERSNFGGWDIPPTWFRGCMVVLCYRLDTPEFVKAEVYRMAKALKASHRNEGIGLLFDGRNVVGVALDDTHVRHSPALPMYNHQLRLMDGFRLMMHLLSPCLLSEKTPWRPSAPQPSRSTIPLPMEIVVRISQFLDSETYDSLSLVSFSFRRLYLTYPRLGDIILLQPAPRGIFHVFDTVRQRKSYGLLVRDIQDTDTGLRLLHRQPKLGPIFFTPAEYAKWRDEFKKKVLQHSMEYTLRSLTLAHVVRLLLQVSDEHTPESSEPVIPKKADISMQVVLGCWTLQRLDEHEVDEVWYRYYVAELDDPDRDADFRTEVQSAPSS